MLATSILTSPRASVKSPSGPSKKPSNLLKCPRRVDTARCFAENPTFVWVGSISYLTICLFLLEFEAAIRPQLNSNTCLRKQLFQMDETRRRGQLLPTPAVVAGRALADSGAVGRPGLAPAEPDSGDHRHQEDCQGDRKHGGPGLAGADRGAQRAPVDRGSGVQPGDEACGESCSTQDPDPLGPGHLPNVESPLPVRDMEVAQPSQQHDPDDEHHQPDPERDPRIGGLVDWREVGGYGPGGQRQRPDEA